MRIERFDPQADRQRLRACYELVVSGQAEDDPKVPPLSYPAMVMKAKFTRSETAGLPAYLKLQQQSPRQSAGRSTTGTFL